MSTNLRTRPRWRATAALIVAALVCASAADAQPYVRLGLGAAFAAPLTLDGDGYDSATRCDWITNPQRIEAGPECDEDNPLSEWRDRFGRAHGLASSAATGYRWRNVRVEAEYFHRTTAYDEYFSSLSLDAVGIDKRNQELAAGGTTVWDVESHSLFTNVYYDFRPGSRWRPFVGAGVGLSRVTLDYATVWRRHHDPDRITTFMDPLLRARLAGTTTIGHARLRGMVIGSQLLGGINRRITDRVSAGVLIRVVSQRGFESPQTSWDQLRSHESSTGRGDLVWYRVRTDMSYWSASLALALQL